MVYSKFSPLFSVPFYLTIFTTFLFPNVYTIFLDLIAENHVFLLF